MYRDDKGGWIRASELEGISHKVVGTDFRGLPIIHIGRGRPKTRVIKLLMQDPNITAQTGDSNDTVQKGKTVGNNNNSLYIMVPGIYWAECFTINRLILCHVRRILSAI